MKNFNGITTVMHSGVVVDQKIRQSNSLSRMRKICLKDFSEYRKLYPLAFVKIEYRELVGGRYINIDLYRWTSDGK